MTYVGLLYQDLIRSKDSLPGRQLPPVLPIVLYNGDARWTAETDIAALIPKVPGLVSRYLPKVQDLKELKMSLAQRFDEWAEQHEQRGEVKVLQRLLTLRFGELPVSAIDRLKEANTEQLEAWTERVLSASTLEDVLQG